MLNFLSSLFQIETMITILVGMAAFATVLTVRRPSSRATASRRA